MTLTYSMAAHETVTHIRHLDTDGF